MGRHFTHTANAIANGVDVPQLDIRTIISMTTVFGQRAAAWMRAAEQVIHKTSDTSTLEVAFRLVAVALEKIARHELRQEQERDSVDWHKTMIHLMQSADSKAYAYVKGTALICPEGDIISFRDNERKKWKAIWAGNDEPTDFEQTALLDGHLANNRAPLTVEEIRQAAKSFSTKTSTSDWWHPRIFGWLQDAQLQKLADIMFVWECIGTPAIPNDRLMVKMIPKPAGGFRPIGFFPSLVRLWGKARQQCIKNWAKINIQDGFINMAPNRRVGDSTWRHKVRSRLDASKGDTVLEGLWDVQKSFEQVNGTKLVSLAEALGYPTEILAVSLST